MQINEIFSPLACTRVGHGNLNDTVEVIFLSKAICDVAKKIFTEYKSNNPNLREYRVERIHLNLGQLKGKEPELQASFQAAMLQNKGNFIDNYASWVNSHKNRCTSDPQREADSTLQQTNQTALNLLNSLDKLKNNSSTSYDDLTNIIPKSKECVKIIDEEIQNYKTRQKALGR